VLKKGDPGVARLRVLVEAMACSLLYNSVTKLLQVNLTLMITSCKCHPPKWIYALDHFSKRLASDGKIHRDTACVLVGNLSVIAFLKTSGSEGVKFLETVATIIPR
jgi:hypothetical protein